MTLLPPAPNWFSAQILRTSKSGLVAYGAKNGIVVLNTFFTPNENDENGSDSANWRQQETPSMGSTPKGCVVNSAFSDKAKVTALTWSPDSSHLAVTADDGQVKLFKVKDDAETVTCTHTHYKHRELSKDRHKINSISWSKKNDEQVLSGDEVGTVVIWDVKSNSTRYINVGKHNIFVLETNPFNGDLIAFGCRLGLVFVVDISGSGKIIHKIRGHDEDIQGLSWSPSNRRDVLVQEEDIQEESLLAVSSRDKTVTIWSAISGLQVAILTLPGANNSFKGGYKDTAKMTWSTCHWWRKNVIFTSGTNRELLVWNLDRVTKQTADGIFRAEGQSEMQVVHREHARTIYSIDSTCGSILTSGQDRGITSFKWSSSHSLDFNLPAFAAWIYTMVANPVDPSIVAMGAGDGQIRIWKMASTKAMYDINTIWQKLNSAKITALAWHPDKENMLAFATDEGRVGMLDALSGSKTMSPTFNDYKHRTTVYNLCWGPPCSSSGSGGDNSKKVLYSCGDGLVMMHASKHESQRTVNIEEVIVATNGLSRKAPSRSDVLFQPMEYRYMVVGSDDGSVEVLAMPNLQLLCTIKSFQKLIQSLAWHPYICSSGNEASPYKNWLAVASNEFDIHVWDLTNVKAADHQSGDGAPALVMSQPTVVLSGHRQRVIYLAWNPQEDGQLLSVSYDGTAQVWDAVNNVPLANFSGHTGRLFCGLWSPVDRDVVLTGGEDSTVYLWHISKQENKLPPKKSAKKAVQKMPVVIKQEEMQVPDPVDEVLALLEEKKQEIVAEENGEVTATAKDNSKKRRQKKRIYFPVSVAKENAAKPTAYDDCSLLARKSAAEKIDLSGSIHLNFFDDKFAMDQLIDAEVQNLKESGLEDAASNLRLWQGDLGECVRDGIRNGKLNDWLVSMAAGTSYSLWQEACAAYAVQLIKDDDVVKGASYHLMVHQVLEAIEALRKSHFFRAAITIAKSRLPNDSPVLSDLYSSWAVQATNDGSYELAAKCWIAAGDLGKAAAILARRPDPSSLRVASNLMSASGEEDKARILAIQCATNCDKNADWECFELLAQETQFEQVKKMWQDNKDERDNGNKPLI